MIAKIKKINPNKSGIPMANWLWDSMKSIRRSPYQSLVAVLTVALTVYNLTIVTLQVLGANEVISFLESRPAVSAYFTAPPTQEELTTLRVKLEEVGELKEFTFITQEQALEIYKQQNQNEPDLLEMVTANILPASVEISPKDPHALKQMAQILTEYEGIDDVIYHQEVIDEFLKWTKSIRVVGLESVGFLGVLSFLVVFVIMSMKVAMKRREINILQLVGATKWYIRRPFIVEASIYAVIGALIGWIAAYTRLQYATPFLLDLFMFMGKLPEAYELNTMLLILLGEVLLAIIWAVMATSWAVSRFLGRSS